MGLLLHGHGGDAPDGGELGVGIGAVCEVVVEGVARPCFCSPTGGFRGRGPPQVGTTPLVLNFRALIRDGETEVEATL